jgi:hypothetical protein
MILFNRDSGIQSSSRRFYTAYKSVKLDPSQPSGERDIPSRHSTVQASSVRTTRTFHPDLPYVEKLLTAQLASVRTFQQHVRAPSSVRSAMGFLSKI